MGHWTKIKTKTKNPIEYKELKSIFICAIFISCLIYKTIPHSVKCPSYIKISFWVNQIIFCTRRLHQGLNSYCQPTSELPAIQILILKWYDAAGNLIDYLPITIIRLRRTTRCTLYSSKLCRYKNHWTHAHRTETNSYNFDVFNREILTVVLVFLISSSI